MKACVLAFQTQLIKNDAKTICVSKISLYWEKFISSFSITACFSVLLLWHICKAPQATSRSFKCSYNSNATLNVCIFKQLEKRKAYQTTCYKAISFEQSYNPPCSCMAKIFMQLILKAWTLALWGLKKQSLINHKGHLHTWIKLSTPIWPNKTNVVWQSYNWTCSKTHQKPAYIAVPMYCY